MVTYVLDVNIVIKLWNDNPDVLDLIELHQDSDFIVTNEVLLELVNGEVDQFCPEMSPRYIKIVKHMRNSGYAGEGGRTKTPFLIKVIEGKPHGLSGNRIAYIDLSTIMFCQNNPAYYLVTSDGKMIKSAIKVLEKDHVLNYNDFIRHLQSRGVV